MDKGKTVNKKIKVWTNTDVLFLASIFYLLGAFTAILCYIFLIFHEDPSIHEENNKPSLHPKQTNSSYNSPHLFLPEKEKIPLTKENEYLLWETSTVIRSALFQFVKANGKMPITLTSLTPEYLPDLPRDPIKLSNDIVRGMTGEGGWVYNPIPILSTDEVDIINDIEASLFPNIEHDFSIGFKPLEIIISNPEHTLRVVSGNHTIRTYPVGVGREGKIITGTFTIRDKVMNPNKHLYPINENPYGKRGLELSNPMYAIHGTYKTQSIGANQSNGCIRMLNEDVIELYSMVPIHTKVEISDKRRNPMEEKLPLSIGKRSKFLYDQDDHPTEEELNKTYSWSG
ncbi:L,D-transpeptidase [Peribacillus acanthi]|uniref:L,D-transpeptidase n=1 Tax=Peribacillus acanthi TaxID=2171554 RepID=UPI000D3EDC76|nr:L,D-transpeptidase [Peribacillus acanthi]